MFSLYFSYMRWEEGGDYLSFYCLIRRMVKAWRAVGFELVFVFDGAKPLAKHDTVASRLEESIRCSRKFHEVLNASEGGDVNFRGKRIMPLFCFDTVVAALSSLKVAMEFVPDGEADAAIVALAQRRSAYILGNDSDFVILAAASPDVRGYIPTEGVQWVGHSKRRCALLPPAKWRDAPALHVLVYSTPAFCKHLGLRPQYLALMSSLVGNDYVSFEGFWKNVRAREDAKLANVGEDVPQPPPYWRIQYTADILRDIPTPDLTTEEEAVAHVSDIIAAMRGGRRQRDELVDYVVAGVLQYALPRTGACCKAYPFCGDECHPPLPTVKAYADAQRAGQLKPLTNAYMAPDRLYPWSLAEDPAFPPGRSSLPSATVRALAYAIFFSAVSPRTEVTEYDRNAADRLEARVQLLPRTPSATACVLPLHERIKIYLSPFGHAVARAIGKLPPHLHPLAAALRLCVLLPPAAHGHWSHAEVYAVARSAIGTLDAFDGIHSDGSVVDADLVRAPLSSRVVQRVAQFSASLHDLHILAQSLLLSTPGKVKTHLYGWKFIDGASLHSLLNGREPTGSAWRAPAEDQVHAVVEAALKGLDKRQIADWGVGVPEPISAAPSTVAPKNTSARLPKHSTAAPKTHTTIPKHSATATAATKHSGTVPTKHSDTAPTKHSQATHRPVPHASHVAKPTRSTKHNTHKTTTPVEKETIPESDKFMPVPSQLCGKPAHAPPHLRGTVKV